jgi:DinB family protein
MNKDERLEKIELYRQGYGLLGAALTEIPREAWDFKPSPADWSVHEIIVHMADSESMAALRARKLIVEPGSTLMGYEEAKWAAALKYEKQDTDDALQVIKLARITTYHLLRSLPEQVFKHTVHHPDYAEPYTFDTWLNIYSKHIPDHIEQIRNNLKVWQSTRR